MADDPNPALRAELLAAEGVLDPQLRGLAALLATMTPDLMPFIEEQIAVRQRRRDLIQAVLDALDSAVTALDALDADGYPTPIPRKTIPESAFKELEGEVSDVGAGAALFDGAALARIDLDGAVHTQQPLPPA